jgi:polysaccharide export outer membrane protein
MSMPFDAGPRSFHQFFIFASLLLVFPRYSGAQAAAEPENKKQETPQTQTTSAVDGQNEGRQPQEFSSPEPIGAGAKNEYRIGSNDVVEINVFEAPELNRKLRVASGGEISVPLLGTVRSGGLTARELEAVLESQLRGYMKDPHVGVFVSTVESHPVSVLGAVKKPGVFQVREPKTVLEMLSMAEGLADDAGDAVLVMRNAGADLGANFGDGNQVRAATSLQTASDNPSNDARGSGPASGHEETIRINLKNLLQSEDSQLNVPVYPGDIVKVVRAGVVYVVGEVKKPGGFVLKSDERMSVLKAIALAEGLTPTSAKSGARIIRSDSHGTQPEEIPINLGKILAGKQADPTLSAADIVFVPNSAGKTATYKGSQAVISALVSLMIFRW